MTPKVGGGVTRKKTLGVGGGEKETEGNVGADVTDAGENGANGCPGTTGEAGIPNPEDGINGTDDGK